VLARGVTANLLAQVSVLNVNYDKEQTGANLQETILQPSQNWATFGKLGTYAVDGQVYTQPLYVPGVSINSHAYNVVYVATMHNSVYAFDADSPQTATPLWQVNLGPSVPSGEYNFNDILPEIGILGTPAIDATNQVLYVVANTLPPGSASVPIFQLHALSLVDGHEMNGGPVQIAATFSGNGAGSSAGTIAFDATQQLQRPGLMLANGMLYIGFGSHADAGNYHGWLMAYDPSTLQFKAVFNTSPNGRQSAIWQSGRAPAIDTSGDIYAVTGNGDWDGQVNFGESVMHFSGTDLSLKDWYTPQEWSDLNSQDEDMGSAGAILIPNTNLLLSGGKAGMLYLVQTESMGHLGPDDTSTVQGVQVNGWGMFNMVLWSQETPVLYEFEPFLNLKAFQIVKGQINSTILSQYAPPISSAYVGMALSANGTQNGILWLTTGDLSVDGVPGTLHALDATNLAVEYWNSGQASNGRDTLGGLAKFATPTIANGRVYVPTFSNSVTIYGALGPSSVTGAATISSVLNGASFLDGPVAPGELVTIFGANIGPPAAAGAQLVGQQVSSNVGSTSVTFDGVAAPLLYASSTQINTIVPFGVQGPNTQVQVMYQGNAVASTTVPVTAASPAVFALNGSGGGPGAILNDDYSVNSNNNPAAIGSFITLYATGGGATTPSSQDGFLTAAPYPTLNLPVTVTIEGVNAQVLYAGPAPGQVAGVLQITVVVPENAWVAPFDQVVVTIGTYVSPSAVTVAVK